MWTFNVKRVKRIEDLLTEADKINKADKELNKKGEEPEPGKKEKAKEPSSVTSTSTQVFSKPVSTKKSEEPADEVSLPKQTEPEPEPVGPAGEIEPSSQREPELSALPAVESDVEKYDAMLDKFMSIALAQDGFSDIEVKEATRIIDGYLEFCKYRLAKSADQIKELLSQPGSPQNQIKALADQQFDIATKIVMLEKIYDEVRSRPDTEVKALAETVIKKIEEIQTILADEYSATIESAGKKNYDLLQTLETAKSESEKREIAKEIVNAWQELNIITSNLDEQSKQSLAQAQNQTYDKVSGSIGREELDSLVQGAAMNREEADLIARIVKLNYRTFTSEAELRKEFADVRTKINSLRGSSKFKAETSPETIKYLAQMVDMAELSIYARFKNKKIELSKAQGIRFDYNKRLKLYEKTALPVTGKQIADESTVMKLRKGLQSLLSLLFGGAPKVSTEQGEAWANFGSRFHNIYAKTLNTAAKTAGRIFGGRAGEIAGDSLSRMFIPDTTVLDTKGSRSLYEEAVSPGLSFQVPSSIGSMGEPVAPTPTSVGSGDNFSPRKKKPARKRRILEFKEFVSQVLK